MEYGKSFDFIGRCYPRSLFKTLKEGDYVIIHPIKGVSQATISHRAKIVTEEYGEYGIKRMELILRGVGNNSKWSGALLNEYGFSRLEFVSRKENTIEVNGL